MKCRCGAKLKTRKITGVSRGIKTASIRGYKIPFFEEGTAVIYYCRKCGYTKEVRR